MLTSALQDEIGIDGWSRALGVDARRACGIISGSAQSDSGERANASAAKWRVSRCFKRKAPASFALIGRLTTALRDWR
jgi:hypothetical protein